MKFDDFLWKFIEENSPVGDFRVEDEFYEEPFCEDCSYYVKFLMYNGYEKPVVEYFSEDHKIEIHNYELLTEFFRSVFCG